MSFITQVEAAKLLKALGRKSSIATLRREIKKGRLPYTPQGVSLDDLLRYATTLDRTDPSVPVLLFQGTTKTGEPEDQSLTLAERKEQAETEKAEASAAMAKLKLKLAQGQVIPREQFISEMASRLVILREGFRLEAESRVQEVIASAGGKPENGDAVSALLASLLDAQLAAYAKPIIFHTVLDEEGGGFEEGDEE